MNNLFLRLLFFSLIITSIGCSEERKDSLIIRLNHYQHTGYGAFPQLVYLSQEGNSIGSNQWQFFYNSIEGFDFEPGFIYQLEVIRENIADPPPDGFSYRYELRDVLSKEDVPPDTEFEILLKYEDSGSVSDFIFEENGNFSILGQINIDCGELCLELSALMNSEKEVTGTFQHGLVGDYLLLELNTKW